MASTKLTDYEIKRLENIRRNGDMMASLKIHSIATEVSHATKRLRGSPKKTSQNKKPREETTSVVTRRSLRARGMRPDVKGLDDSFTEYEVKAPKSPTLKLGPLSMSEAYRGSESDRLLIEKIVRIAKESIRTESTGRALVCKDESFSGSVKEEEGNDDAGEGSGESEVCKGENSGLSVKSDYGDEVIGEESSEVEVRKADNSDLLVKIQEKEVVGSEFCGQRIRRKVEDSLNIFSLSLNSKNIVRILNDRILALRFFPSPSSRMIVAGNKHGDVGFWNLDHETDEKGKDGVYTYHLHSGPISGISIQPHCLSKVFTSCYDGFIRLMDAEKEVFDLIHYSEDSIYSLAQRSTDVKCLYFGEGYGGLNIWDERSGKCSTQRSLHAERINSIDFNSANPNLMATSSLDGTACIWDLRSIDANKPVTLNIVDHTRSIHSAYFSPSGKCLATTGFDNTVGILGGANFEKSSSILHDNRTGRCISPFKAIWGWTDSHLFIGNLRSGVDIISPVQRKTLFTLRSPNISAVPCRFDVHPYHVGMLAGATGGGQVYVWTLS